MASFPALLIARIADNSTRGEAARLYLRRTISTLPIGELAKVPRSTMKRIGIERPSDRAATATPGTTGQQTTTASASTKRADLSRRRERVASLLELLVLRTALVIALTVTASSVERHVRWSIYNSGIATGEQMGLCLRLDALSDDCRFTIRTDDYSLRRVAELTGMEMVALAAENPALSSTELLPVGAQVRIKRAGDLK